jgi:hypothetical protein
MQNTIEKSTPKKPRKPVRCSKVRVSGVKCNLAALKITLDTLPLCKRCYGHTLIEQKKEELKQSNGRRGPFVPLSIVEMYEESIVDEQLVELREDIAVAEARCRQLLKQIKESPHDNLSFIELLKTNLEQNLTAVKRGSCTYPELVNNVKTLLDEKVSEKILWNEYYKVTELKRKLVAAESKRLTDLGWTPEKVFAIVQEISKIIKPLITDDNLAVFFRQLAENPLFNNQQFKFLPQADLSQLALPDRLTAEMDMQAIEVQKQKDGTYAAGEINE